MYYKIKASQVMYKKYYVQCVECGDVIKGDTIEEVVYEANKQGWVYDYENDHILCKNCKKEVEKNE